MLQFIQGAVDGSWGSRIPDIRARLGVDDQTWGLASTVPAIAEVLALGVVVYLIGRVNTRRMAQAGAWMVLITVPAMALAPTLPVLVAALAVQTFGGNTMATPMTALQLEVQRRYGKPLMGLLIACFSAGAFAGSAAGTISTAAGISPGVQFAVTGGTLGLCLLLTHRWMPDEPAPDRSDDAPRRRVRDRFTRTLVLLGVIELLAALVGTASSGWSALYTSQTLGAGPVWGAATYTTYSIVSAVGLLLTDRILRHIPDHIRFLRLAMAVSAVTFAVGLVIGTPFSGIAAFAIVALGMAFGGPILSTLASNQPNVTPGEAVSVREMGYLPGKYISPALIGLLAGAAGLRIALVAIPIALLAQAILMSGLKTGTDRI